MREREGVVGGKCFFSLTLCYLVCTCSPFVLLSPELLTHSGEEDDRDACLHRLRCAVHALTPRTHHVAQATAGVQVRPLPVLVLLC